MRGLFLNRGMSFRYGSQFTRDYGNFYSYDGQIAAYETQIKLIDTVIQKYNIIFDVAIDSVSTKYDKEVIKLFQNDLIYSNFKDKPDATQHHGIKRVYDSLEDIYPDYDFIFFTRHDLCFTDKFIELFDPNDECLKFPFVHWYKGRKTKNNNPNIADTFYFIPKKYFYLIDDFRNLEFIIGHFHEILDSWLLKYPDLEYNFYVNTYHDSDTRKDWNPLYTIANRLRTEEMASDPNLIFPRDF